MIEAIKLAHSKIALKAGKAKNDLVAGTIVIAALLMFVGLGGSVLSTFISQLKGFGGSVDKTLNVALILNIALIMFGWRRYRELTTEVKQRAEAEERATHLALRDPLTGFHNRRSMSETGSEMLETATRRGKELVMVMLDLDHFKNINDVHGHAVGDALLKKVAAEITALVPKTALTARLGGDEFVCAFPMDKDNQDGADQIVGSIVNRLAQPLDINGVFAHISVSAGIAHSGADCGSIDSLMRHADIAMYAAKRGGKNRFAWFSETMERELQVRNDIETGMRVGIPRNEFVPYFEQQIDLSTGRLSGFEVLARWEHPTKGLIPPDQFVPIAEETGMIADLSMSVIHQALSEAKSWDQSLTISVNISPIQLKDPWLAQKMVKLLVETGFPANRLEVEITETSLFENLTLAQSIVGSLKNQGIRLALDDFGTGYSSLAHLRALPFDRIKIDKSFVTSINENSESEAIVNAITRLGESLGLPVTAEGIEDAEIEEKLRVLGCHKGQGWHFGRPASIASTRTLLAERNLLPAYRDLTESNKASYTIPFDEEDMRATG